MATGGGRHCSPEDLLDLAEGTRAEADVPHLSECAACRAELVELRGLITAARADEVPEPSRLVWQHLEARVHDAVASEGRLGGGVRAHAWTGVRSRWWVGVPAAAGIALAVFMLRGGEPRSPSTAPALEPTTAPVESAAAPVATRSADDWSLAWMSELASRLDQDSIERAGLATPVGVADLAFAELSSDEQRELERLLRDELKGPGA